MKEPQQHPASGRQPSGNMKRKALLFILGLLVVAGCGRPSRDEASLQPYTNIPPGTVVTAQIRVTGNLGEMIMTNEYVLEKFGVGFVTLRGTNGLSLGYAGSMIKSIVRKETGVNLTPNGQMQR